MQKSARQPHAVLDLPSRRLKGLKIEKLLDLSNRVQPIKLLEIGTGSGGIAHYFASHPTLDCEVFAVDVIDQRQIEEGFVFSLVEDTHLPYENDCFDVVLTNHVIEHVGNQNAQFHHLLEIKRVLRSDGECYLAVPNRWMLVEPHYRLIFLSWLPKFMRDPYVRLFRNEDYYDCLPFTRGGIEMLLLNAGFKFSNICTRALKITLEIEQNHGRMAKTIGQLPVWVLDRLSAVNPTLIYKISKNEWAQE